ncbi:trypsin-like peptidase domain-containing protein [Actinosynnema sp. NPDC023587]|uniref:trypsin-like peptidase domain-containing protein n=1 Tax=Actinosynnema sp. NPDC023587 TaxID=3154695 RepID=UPI0034031252
MARVQALLGVVALLALTPLPAAAQPSSPEERAAAVARPGVVYISVTWHGWVRDKRSGEVFGGTAGYEVKTSCSGAVISPDGYVATASHCVHTGPLGGGGALFDAAIADLAKAGRVRDSTKARQQFAEHGQAEGFTPDSPVDRLIQVERMEKRDSGQERDIAPATVVDLVAPGDGDVAVLKIPRENLPSIEVRRDQPPVGAPILAIGYPGSTDKTVDPSLEPSNKNGQISARRTQGGRPFYEFSAAATHGMSGGPVVDMQGGIVGLISQGSPGETQSFNFAASSQTLSEVLERKEVQTGIGQHDEDYRTGLDRFFEGDYDGAATYFDAALAGSPGNQQAADYLKQATDKGGVPGSSPATLLMIFAIICGGVAVATATAGTAIVVSRRKRAAANAAPRVGAPATPAGGYVPATPAGGYVPATPPGGYAPVTPAGGYPATPGGGYPQVSPWANTAAPQPAAPQQAAPQQAAPQQAVPQQAVPPAARPKPTAVMPQPFPTTPAPVPPLPGPAQPGAGQPGAATPDGHPTVTRQVKVPIAEDAPTVSTSAPDLSALPVVLGVDPQTDRQRDADQADGGEGRGHQADDQTQPRRRDVDAGTPPAGHPRADQADHGDQAHGGDEGRQA